MGSGQGFGFITRDDGQADIFVHSTGVVGQSSRDQELYAGDEVTFEVHEKDKKLRAENVSRTGRKRDRGYDRDRSRSPGRGGGGDPAWTAKFDTRERCADFKAGKCFRGNSCKYSHAA